MEISSADDTSRDNTAGSAVDAIGSGGADSGCGGGTAMLEVERGPPDKVPLASTPCVNGKLKCVEGDLVKTFARHVDKIVSHPPGKFMPFSGRSPTDPDLYPGCFDDFKTQVKNAFEFEHIGDFLTDPNLYCLDFVGFTSVGQKRPDLKRTVGPMVIAQTQCSNMISIFVLVPQPNPDSRGFIRVCCDFSSFLRSLDLKHLPKLEKRVLSMIQDPSFQLVTRQDDEYKEKWIDDKEKSRTTRVSNLTEYKPQAFCKNACLSDLFLKISEKINSQFTKFTTEVKQIEDGKSEISKGGVSTESPVRFTKKATTVTIRIMNFIGNSILTRFCQFCTDAEADGPLNSRYVSIFNLERTINMIRYKERDMNWFDDLIVKTLKIWDEDLFSGYCLIYKCPVFQMHGDLWNKIRGETTLKENAEDDFIFYPVEADDDDEEVEFSDDIFDSLPEYLMLLLKKTKVFLRESMAKAFDEKSELSNDLCESMIFIIKTSHLISVRLREICPNDKKIASLVGVKIIPDFLLECLFHLSSGKGKLKQYHSHLQFIAEKFEDFVFKSDSSLSLSERYETFHIQSSDMQSVVIPPTYNLTKASQALLKLVGVSDCKPHLVVQRMTEMVNNGEFQRMLRDKNESCVKSRKSKKRDNTLPTPSLNPSEFANAGEADEFKPVSKKVKAVLGESAEGSGQAKTSNRLIKELETNLDECLKTTPEGSRERKNPSKFNVNTGGTSAKSKEKIGMAIECLREFVEKQIADGQLEVVVVDAVICSEISETFMAGQSESHELVPIVSCVPLPDEVCVMAPCVDELQDKSVLVCTLHKAKVLGFKKRELVNYLNQSFEGTFFRLEFFPFDDGTQVKIPYENYWVESDVLIGVDGVSRKRIEAGIITNPDGEVDTIYFYNTNVLKKSGSKRDKPTTAAFKIPGCDKSFSINNDDPQFIEMVNRAPQETDTAAVREMPRQKGFILDSDDDIGELRKSLLRDYLGDGKNYTSLKFAKLQRNSDGNFHYITLAFERMKLLLERNESRTGRVTRKLHTPASAGCYVEDDGQDDDDGDSDFEIEDRGTNVKIAESVASSKRISLTLAEVKDKAAERGYACVNEFKEVGFIIDTKREVILIVPLWCFISNNSMYVIHKFMKEMKLLTERRIRGPYVIRFSGNDYDIDDLLKKSLSDKSKMFDPTLFQVYTCMRNAAVDDGKVTLVDSSLNIPDYITSCIHDVSNYKFFTPFLLCPRNKESCLDHIDCKFVFPEYSTTDLNLTAYTLGNAIEQHNGVRDVHLTVGCLISDEKCASPGCFALFEGFNDWTHGKKKTRLLCDSDEDRSLLVQRSENSSGYYPFALTYVPGGAALVHVVRSDAVPKKLPRDRDRDRKR